MTARRSLIFLALLTATPLALGSSGAAAATGEGRFLTPFREDKARFGPSGFTGGFAKGGAIDGNGCLVTPSKPGQTGAPAGNPNAYDCLPAGASMVMMPNGKVAFWNALEGEEQITGTDSALLDGGRKTVDDESRVLDLRSGKPVFSRPSPVGGAGGTSDHADDLPLGPLSAQHYPYNTSTMFCSDQKLLANGDIIDAGGTDYYSEPYIPVVDKGVIELGGVKNTRIFHADTQRWTLGPAMSYGRWYPSLVTLGNGNLFIASGVEKLIKPAYVTHPLESGTNVKHSETLDVFAKKPAWKVNPASADKSLPLFPRLHLLPNGHVFYDAAGQAFNPVGQSYDEALWVTASSYDPNSESWNDLGVPGTDLDYLAANPNALPFAGFRGSTFSAALTMRPTAVVGGIPSYTSASYLTAGGVLGTSPGSYLSIANSRITTVSTAGGESMKTTGTKPLNRTRWYGTATPLPNGQVFVSSGADVDEVLNPGFESPIRSTELFTPTIGADGSYTGGYWKVVGDQARKRTYHNNALLQPDGSVLIGGHAPIVTGYFQTIDGPNVPPLREGTNNHHDASFQVWQPPYVGDPGRPVVTRVDPHGRTLVVATKDAGQIASVVLMRNTAQTHLVDGDARTVSLPVLSRTAGSVTVGLPATTNVLPAGPYQLFVNKSKTADLSGRNPADLLPSVGKQLFISGRSLPVVLVPGQKAAAKATAKASATLTAKGARALAAPAPVAGPVVPATTTPSLALAARRSREDDDFPVVPALGVVAVALAYRRSRQLSARRGALATSGADNSKRMRP